MENQSKWLLHSSYQLSEMTRNSPFIIKKKKKGRNASHLPLSFINSKLTKESCWNNDLLELVKHRLQHSSFSLIPQESSSGTTQVSYDTLTTGSSQRLSKQLQLALINFSIKFIKNHVPLLCKQLVFNMTHFFYLYISVVESQIF